MKIRSFVAIELSEDTRQACREHARRLAAAWPAARWTRPEDLHLTVCFLGGVEEARLSGLEAALAAAADSARSFGLSPAGIELAPPGRRPPTMIWASMNGSEGFERLAVAVRRAAAPFAPEMPAAKAVLPHVTLARFGRGAAASGGERPKQPPRRPRPFTVTGFTLFGSRLERSGPAYQALKKYVIKQV